MQDSQPNGAIWNARQLQSACRAGEGGFVSEPEPCTNAAETHKLGDTLKDRYPAFDIGHIKAGQVVGWRGELERQAAAAGEAWKPSQTVA